MKIKENKVADDESRRRSLSLSLSFSLVLSFQEMISLKMFICFFSCMRGRKKMKTLSLCPLS
jgi:hypothetical protein